MRKRDIHHGRAALLQQRDRFAHAVLDVGVESIGQVAGEPAEAQSFERSGVEGIANLLGVLVQRVVEEPRVGDRRGERSDVIELTAERHDAGCGNVSPLRP